MFFVTKECSIVISYDCGQRDVICKSKLDEKRTIEALRGFGFNDFNVETVEYFSIYFEVIEKQNGITLLKNVAIESLATIEEAEARKKELINERIARN